MPSIIITFIVFQVILLLFMALHDWVSIPPFNNVEGLKQAHTPQFIWRMTIINTSMVAIPLAFTIIYAQQPVPLWAALIMSIIYLLITIGTITAWWIPYLFGSSEAHKLGFAEYKNTHHFLPPRGDNVIPNTLHVVLHFFAWSCLAISLYLLVAR